MPRALSEGGTPGDGPGTDGPRAPVVRAGRRLMELAAPRVGTTLDLFRTAAEVAEVAVAGFADLAVVELLDPVLRGETPDPGPTDGRAAVRRAAIAAGEGREPRRLREIGEAWVPQFGSPYALALADLRPRLVRALSPDDPWLVREPELAEFAHETGVHSMIAAPLLVRGTPLGVASFYRFGAERAFGQDDLAQVADLVAFGAVCLDNARRHVREKALARLVQRTLVPRHLPAHVAAETAWTYLPVAAGGSWFDLVPVSGARMSSSCRGAAATPPPSTADPPSSSPARHPARHQASASSSAPTVRRASPRTLAASGGSTSRVSTPGANASSGESTATAVIRTSVPGCDTGPPRAYGVTMAKSGSGSPR